MTNPIASLLFDRDGIRALDKIASEKYALPSYELMQRAGVAVFTALKKYWPTAKTLAICCGTGNNGGDGYVVARLAAAAGYKISVYQLGDPQKITGAAAEALAALNQAGIAASPWSGQIAKADLIIDAIFGTALAGAVSGEFLAAIKIINAAHIPVLAIDIPSGLDVNTGVPLGAAVYSNLTVTFIGRKQGMYTGVARDYCGRIVFASLDVLDEIYSEVQPSALRLPEKITGFNVPRRLPSAHKGDFGRVLLIGGGESMPGAVCLASEAALRVGAGLVTVATYPGHAPALPMRVPEAIVVPLVKVGQLKELLKWATVILIGPGLGNSSWAQQIFKMLFKLNAEHKLPIIIDADGLNLLAQNPSHNDNYILTPHPGEAARLLKTDVATIEADRYRAIKTLQERYGGAIILKGAGTLVLGNDKPRVCCLGNPGMASAGMGDVLAGVVVGLLAQGAKPEAAACLGTFLHSAAADLVAAEHGQRGILARDVLLKLPSVLNGKDRN